MLYAYVMSSMSGFEKLSTLQFLGKLRRMIPFNADLARLGNLFKLALDEGTDLELEQLMGMIAETQLLLKSKVMEL